MNRSDELAITTNSNAVGKFAHPDAVTDRVGGLGMALSLGFAWGGR